MSRGSTLSFCLDELSAEQKQNVVDFLWLCEHVPPESASKALNRLRPVTVLGSAGEVDELVQALNAELREEMLRLRDYAHIQTP